MPNSGVSDFSISYFPPPFLGVKKSDTFIGKCRLNSSLMKSIRLLNSGVQARFVWKQKS
jgi:hypothetical protein